jgi:hypothetical protein
VAPGGHPASLVADHIGGYVRDAVVSRSSVFHLLTPLLAGCSRGEAFRLPYCRSEVVSQSLRARLADVELLADRANRRHAIRCQLIGEYLGRLLLKRIPGFRFARHAIRHHLRTADNHHEQLVRPDQRDRRPRSHRRPDVPVPQAMGHVGRERRRDAQAEDSGRVADRATIAALGWRGGDRLTLTAEAEVMIARRPK